MTTENKAAKQMQALVAELQNLRNLADAAQIRLIRRAREIELRQKNLWVQFYPTFDEMLKKNDVCDPTRYRNIVAADEAIGQKQVDSIGSHAAAEVIKIKDEDRRDKFVEAAKKRVEDEHVIWSREEAVKQRHLIGGSPPRDSIYNERVTREDELYKQVVELKKENAELKRKLKEKEEEIAKLSKKLKPVSSAGKTASAKA